MDYKYTSRSVDDTIRIAQDIESEKFPNMVICLYGELGSGKTVFTKGFASAMEIEETITSPTFNIIKRIYFWRNSIISYGCIFCLEDTDESIGFNDYFNKGGVTIIEWADIIKDKLPEKRLDIKFKFIDEDTRVLVLIPHGEEYEEICNAVL